MKFSNSKILFGVLFVSAIVLVSLSICAAADTIENIANNGDSFDGKRVSVEGTVSNLKHERPAAGKDYTTFMLVGQAGGRIKVWAAGALDLKPEQKVRVRGVYHKVKIINNRYYNNEIEASSVK
jgi:hypothetical protein